MPRPHPAPAPIPCPNSPPTPCSHATKPSKECQRARTTDVKEWRGVWRAQAAIQRTAPPASRRAAAAAAPPAGWFARPGASGAYLRGSAAAAPAAVRTPVFEWKVPLFDWRAPLFGSSASGAYPRGFPPPRLQRFKPPVFDGWVIARVLLGGAPWFDWRAPAFASRAPMFD